MDKNSNTPQRKKHENGINDGSDMSQSATRTRQKRGSTSQTSVSSSLHYTEESNQCNGLSTSANKSPKPRSASVLSSSDPSGSGHQRRSARLSQLELQNVLNTPENKKKKSDDQKTPGKDKRKGRLSNLIEENESETYVSNKRTSGKSKKNTSLETMMKNYNGGDEEGEPVEKKAKKTSRRSKVNELPVEEDIGEEEKEAENKSEICLPSKSKKKRKSKLSELLVQGGSGEEEKHVGSDGENGEFSGVPSYKSSKKWKLKQNELPMQEGCSEEKHEDNDGENYENCGVLTSKSSKKRKSKVNELPTQEDSGEEEKQVHNIKNENYGVPSKSNKKRTSKKQILCEPLSHDSDHRNAENKIVTSKQKTENQEEAPASSKRKKSTTSATSSTPDHASKEFEMQAEEIATSSKMYKGEERIQSDIQSKKLEVDSSVHEDFSYKKLIKPSDNTVVSGVKDIAYKTGNGSRRSADTPFPETQILKLQTGTSETFHSSLKGEKVSKESYFSKMSSISPTKEDLVQEYNRSISEKISLLKPKAFVGRSSASFRKTIIDHCDGSGQEVDSDAESRRAIMESAQRRIEQNLSTSESDSRLFRGMHTPMAQSSKNDSSESDSAPEVVSFSNARQDAMDTIKSAAEHVKRERQRLKERRKARLEMLKQQKEEKLIRLKEKMASQEDASCSSSEESGYEEEIRNARQKLKKKKAKSKTQRTEKENLDEAVGNASVPKPPSRAASDDSSEEDGIAAKDAASLGSLKRVQTEMFHSAVDAVSAKLQKIAGSSYMDLHGDIIKMQKNSVRLDEADKKDRGFKNLTSLDYIPLSSEGATKFMVVPLDKAMRAPKSLAEEAADFRQKMLFGSRIKRESAKVLSAHKQKLIAGKH